MAEEEVAETQELREAIKTPSAKDLNIVGRSGHNAHQTCGGSPDSLLEAKAKNESKYIPENPTLFCRCSLSRAGRLFYV